MSNPNTKRTPIRTDSHLNFMGGTSYDISSPIMKLHMMAASSFFGEPAYYPDLSNKRKNPRNSFYDSRHDISYVSGSVRSYLDEILGRITYSEVTGNPKSSLERAIDDALNCDVESTLRVAVQLRNNDYIRVTPQVILVRAANHKNAKGTGLIRKYGLMITKRGDEPAIQLAYQLAEFGKPVPNSLKRIWADFFKNANDYTLAKYRMESKSVKTVDAARLAYGNGFFGYQSSIGNLLRGDLKLGDEIETWESIRSKGGSWIDATKVMPYMALIRNLRNLIENKVPEDLWLPRIAAEAAGSKQLPFRFLSAYNAVKSIASGKVLDSIEEGMINSMINLPQLPGKSLVLTDNSGSAHGCPISEYSGMTVANIGNLMGVLTGFISDEGKVGVFGDRIEYFPIRKKSSVFDQYESVNKLGTKIGGSTENGIWLALRDAIQSKTVYNNIFVYSDMQAGHGGLYGTNPGFYSDYVMKGTHKHIDVPKLVTTYRNQVNPKVNVFLVQIAGYEDTIIPEFYNRTFIIGGWSDQIFKFAAKMNEIFQ